MGCTLQLENDMLQNATLWPRVMDEKHLETFS